MKMNESVNNDVWEVSEDNANPPVQKKNGALKSLGSFIVSAIVIYLIINLLTGGCFETSYYVAKLQSYNPAVVQVDGYMHKSRSCCKKVADAYGASVIRVTPDLKVGTNSYGQTLKYKDCFYYCPLCCD